MTGSDVASRRYECVVEPDESGERLDVWIARQPFVPSRAFAQRLIADGRVRLVPSQAGVGDDVSERPLAHSSESRADAERTSRPLARHRVRAGERFVVDVPAPAPVAAHPESIPLDIVYEDADLVVVNKRRGMVVHAGAGHTEGTLVNALLSHCGKLSGVGGKDRPGIVHRLDKETTGLLVAAKNDVAHMSLARQIKERSLSRVYVAIVRGIVPHERGRVEANISRHPVHRRQMAVTTVGGRPAVTHFAVLERLPGYTLLELQLETGRTHQIRVHMAHIGFPVAGDPVYGRAGGGGRGRKNWQEGSGRSAELGLSAQALHAWRLGLTHPRSGERVEFSAPPPPDFVAALASLGSDQAESLGRQVEGNPAARQKRSDSG